VLLGLYLSFLRRDHIPHAMLFVQEHRHQIMQHLGILFLPAEAPPEPPPTLITAAVALSSPMDIFEASPCGEQVGPALFPFLCARHRFHELTGVAIPPPSNAGRRGCLSLSPDPLVKCASSPAPRSTYPSMIWLPGTFSLVRADEAPLCAAAQPSSPAKPAATRRTHTSPAVGSTIHGSDPLQPRGRIWP
jgi:hypothetical protein